LGPPRYQELIAQGEAQTFDAAKAAAERAFDKLWGFQGARDLTRKTIP
jgi:hypothetical protein